MSDYILSEELTKISKKINEEFNTRILDALTKKAHWICFKTNFKGTEINITSQCFVNKIDNANEWDTIYDLKQHTESLLKNVSIGFKKS